MYYHINYTRKEHFVNDQNGFQHKKRGPIYGIAHLFKSSLIVCSLTKLFAKLYRAILCSFIGSIFTSYDKVNASFDSSAIASSVNHGSIKKIERSKSFKNGFAVRMESSVLLDALERANKTLLRLSLSSYGILLFSFGFYVSIVYAIKYFAISAEIADASDLIIGITAVAISLLLFISKQSLAEAAASSRIINAVLFELCGVRRGEVDEAAKLEAETYVGVPFIIGMLFGVSSFMISPKLIIVTLAFIAMFVLATRSPEAATVLIFLILPFAQTMQLAVLMCVIFFSFIIKYLSGRRMIKLSMLDIPIFVFAMMTLSGGFITESGDSLKQALLYMCFILGYYLVKVMFRSAAFVNRAMFAISISATIVSIIGIMQYFIGSPSDIWQDAALFSTINGRTVSTFENPNVLGEYLITSIPITMALSSCVKKKNMAFALAVSSLLEISCLVLTWSRGAWLGIIIAGAFTLFLVSKRWLVAGVLSLPIAAAGVTCLGGNVISRFTSILNFSDSSTSYRINIWKSSLKMIGDRLLYGVGVGESAFNTVFPYYAASGITSAFHSHSLYLQITAETGIFSLIIFLTIVFIFVQKALSFAKKALSRRNRAFALGIFCSVTAFLLQGFTDHVWYNNRIYLLFWLVMGLFAAHINQSKESSEENNIRA